MSTLDWLFTLISLVLAIGTFVIMDDERYVVRFSTAFAVGLFWLVALILFALMMLCDGVVGLVRWVRGA